MGFLRSLACAALVVAATSGGIAAAAPSTGERLDRVERRLGATQGKIRMRDRRADVLTDDIARLTQRIRSIEGRLAELRARTATAERRVSAALAELEALQGRLRAERARLGQLRARLIGARHTLAARLVAQYKADNPDVLTVVLNADGFERLLEDAEQLRRIGTQDRRIIEAVRRAKGQSERQTARLAVLEAGQRRVTRTLEQQRNSVAGLQRGVEDVRRSLAAARRDRREQLSRTRASRRVLVDHVAGLRRTQARLRRTLLAAQRRAAGPASTSGPPQPGSAGWSWPVSGTVTSPFCESRSWESCHPGLDIAAPSGTPIRAARAGRVVLMQPESTSGGYGNFTCVQHDASTSSCYAHQSRFATSTGATVRRGQVIGYVGSTGRSTGPHLHFEVRVGGAVTNPFNYL